MKIIGYKSDNVTATLKTVRNCTLLCTAYGVDVYTVPVKKDEGMTDYYYHIGGTKDLLDWLNISSWILPNVVKNLFLNEFTEEEIRTYAPDAKTKIERITKNVGQATATPYSASLSVNVKQPNG